MPTLRHRVPKRCWKALGLSFKTGSSPDTFCAFSPGAISSPVETFSVIEVLVIGRPRSRRLAATPACSVPCALPLPPPAPSTPPIHKCDFGTIDAITYEQLRHARKISSSRRPQEVHVSPRHLVKNPRVRLSAIQLLGESHLPAILCALKPSPERTVHSIQLPTNGVATLPEAFARARFLT